MIGGRSALLSAASGLGYGNWADNYENVSLLLRNGAPILLPVDESPTPKTITTFGDAEISTTTFKYGDSSLVFDGSGDHATIPFDAGFEFGTGDFTVEGWFYFVDINTTLRGIVALGDGANVSGPVTNSWSLQYLGSDGSNQIAFSRYNGATVISYTTTGVSVTPNSWHHIAVCRGSGILRIFFNGVSYYSASNAVNYSVINASHPLRVALQYYGPQAAYDGPRYWNGFIDDLRITKGVARYTSNFSSSLPAELPANATDDPHYSDVSLLLRNGTPSGLLIPLDESPTPKTITAVGNASVTTAVARWNQGSGGSSLAFDGIGDYFDIANPSAAEFGSLDFTIEFWIYAPSGFAASATVISKGISGSVGSDWWTIEGSSGGNLTFYAAPNATPYFTTSAQPWLSNWAHIAICRSGSNSRLFVNGVQSGATYTTLSNFVSGGFIRIGSSTYSASRTMNGYIDDLRITKGIARYETGTGANAGKMVFAGTNTLALPTAQLPANITDDPSYNSVSLLLRNGTPLLIPLDESPTPKTITTFGDAEISTTTFKYGDSSLAFDGSGDYLSLDGSSDFVFGINDFTIEMWAYVNSPGNTGVLYDARPLFTTGAYPMIYSASNTIRYQIFTSDVIVSSSVPLNAWIHIALCRASNSTRLFINGIQNGNTYTDTNNYLNGGSGRPVIGANGPNPALNNFNGYIDDLRITKGIARYTSNFTPPPAELPNF